MFKTTKYSDELHILLCVQLFFYDIGRTPAQFTQLKRHTRFDDFIMFLQGQVSIFHIAAMSRHVQSACSHKIVCTGIKFKSLSNVVSNNTNRFLESQRVQFDLSTKYCQPSKLLKKRSKYKISVLHGSNRLKCSTFADKMTKGLNMFK